MSASPVQPAQGLFVNFPEELVRQIQQAAREENSNVTELLEKSFRQHQWDKLEERRKAFVASLPPTHHTAEDVESLVDEVRAETYAERRVVHADRR